MLVGWHATATAPGRVADLEALDAEGLDWVPAPSTAAAALHAAGRWSLDGPPRRFDAEEWWWRARFSAAGGQSGEETFLCFDGLATLADVWLNGVALLSSDNMFIEHERRVDELLVGDNELVLRFRALDSALAVRRPRPRWRAPMVEHQQLRWVRATLLGRTPGWSPPAAAVGLWRPIRLERRFGVAVDHARMHVEVAGEVGSIEVSCRSTRVGGGSVAGIELVVERDGVEHRVQFERTPERDRWCGRLEITCPRLWWPYTHGEPALYGARLLVAHPHGIASVDLGAIGFRTLALTTTDDDFALSVNGTPIFCRGACWTPLDPVALHAAPAAYDDALAQVRDASMNMLRISGVMVYESDEFFDRCDAHGILIWQDFMFANMDYPEEDASFAATVVEETSQILSRLQGRPSLAILCGNSEGEQQAAMWGAPRERWCPLLFHKTLAAQACLFCPEVPYTPSSAHGGAFPHQASAGPSSYYGVGAYLRPLEDARRAEVRFASECLAFANVPEPRALDPSARVHHPSWKVRTPRDLGAGWDFDDVRDHYLELLFGIDSARLRYEDHERYLALGRAATGEVMAAVFGEWRRARSPCRGGLVWFLRDLWSGAGWGVIDAAGAPKAAYFHLRRALQPVSVALSDEGVNGVFAHVINERPAPLVASLDVALYRSGEVQVASGRETLILAPRQAIERPIAALFDGFLDTSYAYRFGPPSHDLVVATLCDRGTMLAQAFHFPLGRPSRLEHDVGLSAEARTQSDGTFQLTVSTRRFAQLVFIEANGFAAEDNHFHIAPGGQHRVHLRRTAENGTLSGSVQALNAESTTRIQIIA